MYLHLIIIPNHNPFRQVMVSILRDADLLPLALMPHLVKWKPMSHSLPQEFLPFPCKWQRPPEETDSVNYLTS
jgi:hypothetical protein